MRFYLIGLLLYVIPYTRNIFISITALSLLFVFGVVFIQNKDWNSKTLFWFIFIIISSFLLEMYGVNTGQFFGDYHYDEGLGFKIYNTPLIIGFNWLFLIYASHSIARKLTNNALLVILIGSLFMICYDVVVEWVAPFMKMWHFDSTYPPFRNFVTWFSVSVFYHGGMEIFKVNTDNYNARVLFFFQILFFVFIGLFNVIFLR